MKAKYFLTVFFLTSLNLFGQTNTESLKIENYSYPNPSISNLLKWLDLTTMEWENEMKKYEFSDRGIENGCVYYGSGASLKTNVFSIAKCPGNFMSVTWTNFFQIKGMTKLDVLISELEPYYMKTDDKGNSKYAFKNGDIGYEFTVNRQNTGEMVFVKKFIFQR